MKRQLKKVTSVCLGAILQHLLRPAAEIPRSRNLQ